MKKVTFWFNTGNGLVSQEFWIGQDVDPGTFGPADYIYNLQVGSSGRPGFGGDGAPGRAAVQMSHVAFWTYD